MMVNYESHCGGLLVRVGHVSGGIAEVLLSFDAEDGACRGECGVLLERGSWDLFIVTL